MRIPSLAVLALAGCYTAHDRPGSAGLPTDVAPSDGADAGSAFPSWPAPRGTLTVTETYASVGRGDEGSPQLGWLHETLRLVHSSWFRSGPEIVESWCYRRLDAELGELGVSELPDPANAVAWRADRAMAVVTTRYYPVIGPGSGGTLFRLHDASDGAVRSEQLEVPGGPGVGEVQAIADGWVVLHHDLAPRAGVVRISRVDAEGALDWEVDLVEAITTSGSAALAVDGADVVVAMSTTTGRTLVTRVSPDGAILATSELPEAPITLDLARAPDGTFGLVGAVPVDGRMNVSFDHLDRTLAPLGAEWIAVGTENVSDVVISAAPDGWMVAWAELLTERTRAIRVAHLQPDGSSHGPVHTLTEAASGGLIDLTWGGDSAYVAWASYRDDRSRIEAARLRWSP